MNKLERVSTSLVTLTLFLVPGLVFAAPANFKAFVDILLKILAATVPVIFAITVVAILWAGSQMILHADNPEKRADGRRTLMWGVIVLFVMIAMWGFVNLISESVFL